MSRRPGTPRALGLFVLIRPNLAIACRYSPGSGRFPPCDKKGQDRVPKTPAVRSSFPIIRALFSTDSHRAELPLDTDKTSASSASSRRGPVRGRFVRTIRGQFTVGPRTGPRGCLSSRTGRISALARAFPSGDIKHAASHALLSFLTKGG